MDRFSTPSSFSDSADLELQLYYDRTNMELGAITWNVDFQNRFTLTSS